MLTKICGGCKKEKPLSEFYAHKRDGYQARCKECKREYGRMYNRQPKRREYNKQFYKELQASGYFKEYEQKPEVKARKNRQMKQYIQDPRLRVKFLARWYARRMTENGTILQQPCALCGNENSQRHHPDYNKPLLIVWLCADCHRKLHKGVRAKAGEVL